MRIDVSGTTYSSPRPPSQHAAMLPLVTFRLNSAARLGAAARALIPLARHAASGGCAFAAAGRALAGAAQRRCAGAGTVARGCGALQRAPLRQLGAAASAGACAFVRTSCAAAAEVPRQPSPPHCARRLRELAAQMKEKREELKRAQDWATKRCRRRLPSSGVGRTRWQCTTSFASAANARET